MGLQGVKTHIGRGSLYPEVPVIVKTTASRNKASVKAVKKRSLSETPKLMHIGLPK